MTTTPRYVSVSIWNPYHVGSIGAFSRSPCQPVPAFRESPEICPHVVPACGSSALPQSLSYPLRLLSGFHLVSLCFAFSARPGCFCCTLLAPDLRLTSAAFWPLSSRWQLETEGSLSCRAGWTLAPSSVVLWPQERKQGLLCAGAGQSHLAKPV